MSLHKRDTSVSHHYFPSDTRKVVEELGELRLHDYFCQMLLIRNFEKRAEAAYLQGKIGGFFHSYIGQEAIQTAAVAALGPSNWYITSYRCHALALLLGASTDELMAELYGKETGNAKGRGGSMHFFTDRLLGGFGIVAGQVPIATGAAFSLKYLDKKDEVAICFLGDGAVPQGSVHESWNLASLWDLPCIYVIENNQWGMGTDFRRANAVLRLAEEKAPGYAMKAYTLNGMDFFNCYAGFRHIFLEVLKTGRPVLVEAVAQRFRGHSVSDPGLYRSKKTLEKEMHCDPLLLMEKVLTDHGITNAEQTKKTDKELREKVIASMQFAEESPWPNPATLEEDVFAPSEEMP